MEDRLAVAAGPAAAAGGTIVLVPPRGRLGAIAGFGVAGGLLSGGPVGQRLAAAVERDERELLGFGLSSRVELELLAFGGRARELARGAEDPGARATARVAALFAAISARRDLLAGATVWSSFGAGIAFARVRGGGTDHAGVGPAARLALGVGWRQRRTMPFLEASLVAAGASPLEIVPAVAITGGVRFDVGRSHGHHPDRR